MTTNSSPYFDPANEFVDPVVKAQVLEATGNDPEKLRLTNATVGSESIRTIDDTLASIGWSLSRVKIYSAALNVRADIQDVISVCNARGAPAYVGGGYLERADTASQLSAAVRVLQRSGLETVELSNEAGTLSSEKFAEFLKILRSEFPTVYAEVGRKTDEPARVSDWEKELQVALDTGVDRVVLEGGGSGDVGIYHASRSPRSLLVWKLLDGLVEEERQKIVIEAPSPFQPGYWINCGGLGSRARLSNIPMTPNAHYGIMYERLAALKRDAQPGEHDVGPDIREFLNVALAQGKFNLSANHAQLSAICFCQSENFRRYSATLSRVLSGDANEPMYMGAAFGDPPSDDDE